MGDLKAVLSALQGAKGPDREVDAEVAKAIGLDVVRLGLDFVHRINGNPRNYRVPTYTASVDAALALVAEKLPNCEFLIGRGRTRPDEPLYGMKLAPTGGLEIYGGEGPVVLAEHEQLPICILTALFSALSAQSEGQQ